MLEKITFRQFLVCSIFFLFSVPRFFNLTQIVIPYQNYIYLIGILILFSCLIFGINKNTPIIGLSFVSGVVLLNIVKSTMLGAEYMQDSVFLISLAFFFVVKEKDIIPLIKLSFLSNLICLLLMFIFYKINFVSDTLIYDGDKIRHSLGFLNPNGMGFIILVLTIEYFFLSKKSKLFKGLMGLLINSFFFYFIGSRTAFMCYVFFILFYTMLLKLEEKKIKLSVFKILPFFIFLFGTFIFYFYDSTSSVWLKLNSLLSGRPRNSFLFFNEYGFSLFGQNIKEYVLVKNSYLSSWIDSYVLDSSYLRIFFQFGIIVFLLILLFVSSRVSRLYFENYLIEYSILITFLLYGTFDRSVYNVVLVPFMFFLMYPFKNKSIFKKIEGKNNE